MSPFAQGKIKSKTNFSPKILYTIVPQRFKANSFVYNSKEEFWSFALGWGNMDENDYILDSGFMFGFFESGPWLAAKFSKNPAMAWIGGGTKSYEIGVTLF